ncbi:MAG: 23S rRNA (uracil-5-)-methyltransferase RumA, partial [Clostridia bacterium]|nr:23S rRNA (uracil-5-)-methyltransferase RumA [Clostridia bacterium]
LSNLNAERIVYVSCNPATLARDLERFTALGWRTVKVCPVDMFPFAGHCEVVCLLTHYRGI